MSRRNFATVDAVLIMICIVIFAGGVFAQSYAPGESRESTTAINGGNHP
jgi:hypothetical protein